jgi:hypothetical protein
VRGNRSATPASYQFSQLQKDLGRMSTAQRRKLGAEFTRVGQAALSDARSRAGAWSSRIPSAITGRPVVDMTRGRVGYELRADVSEAVPHARVFEGISQQGSSAYFRHPVFGTDRWVSQRTRPFMWPAVRGRAADLRRGVEKAVDDAAREAGFR